MNRNMMEQARQLQAKLAKAQEELNNMVIEATAGGGAIKVTVSGQQKLLSVKISPDVVNPEDVEMLQDLILAAINEAMNKAQEAAAKQLGALTGGLKIPGLT